MIRYPETNRKKALSMLGVERMRRDLVDKVRNCRGCAERRAVMVQGMHKIREMMR